MTALPRPVRQDRFTLPSNKVKIFIVLWPQSNPLVGNPAGEIQVIGLHSFFYKNEILNVVKIYTVPKLESVMAYIRIYIYIQDLFFFFVAQVMQQITGWTQRRENTGKERTAQEW